MMEPFSLYQRKFDKKLQMKMRYPVNPVMASHPPYVKPIPKLHEFCKQRSIPFSDNEDRFYKVVKQRYLQT